MARMADYETNNQQHQDAYEFLRINKEEALNQPLCFIGASKRAGDYGDYWIINAVVYGSFDENDLGVTPTSEKISFLLPSSDSRDALFSSMNKHAPLHNLKLVKKEFVPKGKKTAQTYYAFVSVETNDCACQFLEMPLNVEGMSHIQFEAMRAGVLLNIPFCLKGVQLSMDGTHWRLKVEKVVSQTDTYVGTLPETINLKSTESRDRLFNKMLDAGEFPVHGCMIVRKSFTPKGQTDVVAYYDLVAIDIETCVCGEVLRGPELLDTDAQPW